jgi:uncharacterized repeat protein (TIGR01451 family)
VVTPATAGSSFDPATGLFTVPPTASNGSYSVIYQICAVPAVAPAACDVATATITISGEPDLVTTVTLPPSPQIQGARITATVVFGNIGPAPATNAVVTLQLPPGLIAVAPSNAGVYDPVTGVVTWPPIATIPGNIPLAGTYTVELNAPFNNALSVRSTIAIVGTETSMSNNPSSAMIATNPVVVSTLGSLGLLLLLSVLAAVGAQRRRTIEQTDRNTFV